MHGLVRAWSKSCSIAVTVAGVGANGSPEAIEDVGEASRSGVADCPTLCIVRTPEIDECSAESPSLAFSNAESDGDLDVAGEVAVVSGPDSVRKRWTPPSSARLR